MMKIVHTMASEEPRPLRRNYSPELKAQVVQQCRQPGASVAGIALSHGINANIVHRWLREHAQGTLVVQTKGFVPVKLDPPAALAASLNSEVAPDIRVEIRKGAHAIVVNWPLQGAASCSTWLREWLK